MNRIAYLSLPILLIALTGCTSNNEDLTQWMSEQGNQMKGSVEKLPEVSPFVPLEFVPPNETDPFAPKRTVMAGGVSAPDLDRKKEFLESFPLESLKMIGIIIKKGVPNALVRSPDGNVNVIQEGSYLGQNYGKIQKISEDQILIKELVQSGTGSWAERENSILLFEGR